MATITLAWPFTNPAYRYVTQRFGVPCLDFEPPLPYNADTLRYKATNGREGVRPTYLAYHRGVDFAVPEATPLLAAAAGVVVKAGPDTTGFGNVVAIDAGGLFVSTCHMLAVQVAEGDHVTQGQVVGLSDSTGSSTAPHLHFGVNKGGLWNDDGGWIDPLRALAGGADVSQVVQAGGAGGVAPPAGHITLAQAIYYARQAHVPEAQLATAAAICMAESGLSIAAHNHNAANPQAKDACGRSGSDDTGCGRLIRVTTRSTHYPT